MQFYSIHELLNKKENVIKHIPVRLFTKTSIIQDVADPNEGNFMPFFFFMKLLFGLLWTTKTIDGKMKTVQKVIEDLVKRHLDPSKKYNYFIQGIVFPAQTPIHFVYQFFCFPDNFLYISLIAQSM